MMTVTTFTMPADTPGPRQPALPPHIFDATPLYILERSGITRAQMPERGIMEQRKADA